MPSGFRNVFSRIDRLIATDSSVRSFATRPNTGGKRPLRVAEVGGLAVQRYLTFELPKAEEGARDRLMPRAAQADETNNLIPAQREIQWPDAVDAKIRQPQNVFARRIIDLYRLTRLATDNLLHQLFWRCVVDGSDADHLAIAQDGDAIGDLENLVQAVANIDHANTPIA